MLISLRQSAVLREHVRRSFQISTSVSLVCCSSNTSLPTCITARRFAAKQPESAALLQRAAWRRDRPQLQKTASNKRNRRFLLGLRNRIANLITVCSTLAHNSSFTSTPEGLAPRARQAQGKHLPNRPPIIHANTLISSRQRTAATSAASRRHC